MKRLLIDDEECEFKIRLEEGGRILTKMRIQRKEVSGNVLLAPDYVRDLLEWLAGRDAELVAAGQLEPRMEAEQAEIERLRRQLAHAVRLFSADPLGSCRWCVYEIGISCRGTDRCVEGRRMWIEAEIGEPGRACRGAGNGGDNE